ncbi:hypothetical protein FB45DRAFT_243301 [Roridomyces roridus]|uniref:Uncharacterized protein n=1 Tax=Roridomyces roridus TaxID=1738132 RepID=A0AAD7FED8_9AGAR|nr:hypothetical protein FB45DRAFT_243301 [Roridomyces roridus]
MDPLMLSDLASLNDWDAFQPNLKGFMPPQDLELHPDCEDVETQIREFTDSSYMRDNDAPLITSVSVQNLVTTSITIGGEIFTVPLSSRESSYLMSKGDASASRFTVPGDQVQFVNSSSLKFITETRSSVLRKLRVSDILVTDTSLVGLDVFINGEHRLSTGVVDTNHFATLFVILPSLTPADVGAYVMHRGVIADTKLPQDLSQAASAIRIYAGLADARIQIASGGPIVCLTYHILARPNSDPALVPRLANLAGALSPLRDGFCLWRHKLTTTTGAPKLILFFLDGSPTYAGGFAGVDATLLSHLAPLAKAYGFKLLLGRLTHTMYTVQEVDHPYKEYYNDIDINDLSMDDDPKESWKWEPLTTLGGVKVVDGDNLLDLAAEMVKNEERYKEMILEVDLEEGFEEMDEGIYATTVKYTHTRTASVLFIVS